MAVSVNLTTSHSTRESCFHPCLCFPCLIEMINLNWGSLETSPLVPGYTTSSFCVSDHPPVKQKEVATNLPEAEKSIWGSFQ